ncbi:CoA transferase [Bradyrhizobium sp. 521_C7_N1_3]|uniref:CoA transferase n=1 Tax=Bradyrhizobium sp. 521_C7_N1_3 TaxID=3240368 RepID=UPI003F8BEE46
MLWRPTRGSRRDDLGYDDIARAVSGIMLRFGGSSETPEGHAHLGTIDALGAYSLALGVAAALYQKSKIGRVWRPRRSLTALSGLLQIPIATTFQGGSHLTNPSVLMPRASAHWRAPTWRAVADSIMLNDLVSDLPRLARVDGLQGIAGAGQVGVPCRGDRTGHCTRMAVEIECARYWRGNLREHQCDTF